MRQQAGFSLIELLVVCAVVAAVSYVAWGAYADVDRQAEDKLARAQLLQLAEALKRFHADTGYWPGEGPWRLVSEGGAVVDASVSLSDIENNTTFTKADWFSSPANMTLLYERPELDPAHPLARLATWDAEAHRGWHGPYLPIASRMFVDVWPQIGEADPAGNVRFANVPAFGVGPLFRRVRTAWATCEGTTNDCFLGWHSMKRPAIYTPDSKGYDTTTGYHPDKHQYDRHARPFLFLLEARNPVEKWPRVVYFGADGRYGGTNDAEPCQPNATDPEHDGDDDVVICLQS